MDCSIVTVLLIAVKTSFGIFTDCGCRKCFSVTHLMFLNIDLYVLFQEEKIKLKLSIRSTLECFVVVKWKFQDFVYRSTEILLQDRL